MTSAFERRLQPGVEFEQRLRDKLLAKKDVDSVILNGTEHTIPDFVEKIRNNDSKASIFVRFAPDGVMLKMSGRVIHFDAKHGKSIEKRAYETYLNYAKCGCSVFIFVEWIGEIYWQEIRDLVLIHGEQTVREFSETSRFPVNDGWIYPRKSGNGYDPTRMSGTPYREIDFDSMNKWGEKPRAKKRPEQIQPRLKNVE